MAIHGKIVSAAALVLLFLTHQTYAAFLDVYAGSQVELVSPDNFNELVISPDATVLVQFFAPFSPNCKKFAPVWIELAKMLEQEGETSVRLAMMDADEHREYTRKFGIDGYPSVVIFGKYLKDAPELFKEELTQENLYALAKKYVAMTEEEAKLKKEAKIATPPPLPGSSSTSNAGKASKKKFAVGPKKDKPRVVEEEEEDLADSAPASRPMEFEAPKEEPPRSKKTEKSKKKKKKSKKRRVVEEDSDDEPQRPASGVPDHANYGAGAGAHHHGAGDNGHEERMKDHDRRMAEMHERHNRLIEEITKRHEDHINDVLRRHREAQDSVEQRIAEHQKMAEQVAGGAHVVNPPPQDEAATEGSAAAEEPATASSASESIDSPPPQAAAEEGSL